MSTGPCGDDSRRARTTLSRCLQMFGSNFVNAVLVNAGPKIRRNLSWYWRSLQVKIWFWVNGQHWREQILTSRSSCELENVNIHVSFNCLCVKSVNIRQCLDIREGEMIRLDSYDIACINLSIANWRAYHIWYGDHKLGGQDLPWWHGKHKWGHLASTTIHLDSHEIGARCIPIWEQ